jgi:hypothetical protein
MDLEALAIGAALLLGTYGLYRLVARLMEARS